MTATNVCSNFGGKWDRSPLLNMSSMKNYMRENHLEPDDVLLMKIRMKLLEEVGHEAG